MLWVGSWSGELRRFNKITGTFSDNDFKMDFQAKAGDLRGFDRILCMYKDRNKDLWIGNRSGLHQLIIVPGTPGKPEEIRFRHYIHNPEDPNSLAGNEVESIFEDRAGDFWVSTDSGLNRMDRKTGTFTHYVHRPGDPLSFDGLANGRIAEDHDGFLWIPTQSGIDRLDKQRKKFEHFHHRPDDANSLGKDIASGLGPTTTDVDHAGNIWIAGPGGIDKIDPHQTEIGWFKHIANNKNSLSSNNVQSVFEDKKGAVWFATDLGLDVMERETGKFIHYHHDPLVPTSIGNDKIKSLTEDGEGKIWILSWEGNLDRLDPETGIFDHYIGDQSRFKNVNKSFCELIYLDRRDLLWIGTANNGIISFDYETEKFNYFRYGPNNFNGISDNETNSICEDRKGYIWIGHGSVATDRLDPSTGKIKHYKFRYPDSTGISSNVILTIYKDHTGNLWFGTLGGGLCKYNDSTDRFTSYTEKDGLMDNSIISIQEDNEGNLWLGTGKGICRYSLVTNKFTNFNYPNESKTDKIKWFFCKGKNGTLYFRGGDGGVRTFDPDKVQPNLYIPPVVITQFTLFNEPKPGLNETKEIELNHDQNFFSFEFAALNYTYSENNQYAYKLEGIDKDWVYNGTRRSANYTSIGPGTYTFRVKGSNNEGLWNNDGTSIKIIIRPPWWKTWWAYSLYVLSFLTGVFFIDRYQRKRLIEKERKLGWEKELEMQALRAQMNPHFIFNCLSSINDFVLKNETEAASDYLTKFSRLIRTVLNNSKKSYIALEDELEMLGLYLEMEKLRFNDTFTYNIDIETNLDPSSIFIPPLLLQPFVENAIWHGLMHKTDRGRLGIRLRVEKNILVCVIEDNGVGRSFSQASEGKSAVKQKSMGIQLTRQRLALINGNSGITDNDFVIEDLYDDTGHAAGTKILLRIRYKEMTDETV
jgi:ligand-binding sensor domain-containing protein